MKTIEPILRHVLQAISGVLMAQGVITEEIATQLVGGGLSLGTVVWYLWAKNQSAK